MRTRDPRCLRVAARVGAHGSGPVRWRALRDVSATPRGGAGRAAVQTDCGAAGAAGLRPGLDCVPPDPEVPADIAVTPLVTVTNGVLSQTEME